MSHVAAVRGVAVVASFVALGSSPALADQTARLVYARGAGAEACPDEAALRAAVTARLGYEPFRPVAALTIIASVSHSEGEYHGDLRLLGEKGDEVGSRSIGRGSAGCDDVVSALALSMSVAIDPLLLVRAAAPPGAPPPAPIPAAPVAMNPAPDVSTRTTAPQAEKPVALPARAVTPFLGFAFLGSAGSAPAPALGIEGSGGLRAGRFSVGILARADLPSAPSTEGPASVSSFLLLASLAPCAHVSIAFGCAVASAGVLTASSTGITRSATDRAGYGAVGARVGAELPVSAHVDFVTSVEIGAPLVSHAFSVGGDDVYTPKPVWVALAVGGAYHF